MPTLPEIIIPMPEEEQPLTLYGRITNTNEPPKYDDIMNSNLPREEKARQIQYRTKAYQDDLDRQLHKDLTRIRLGGLVSAVGALPIAITKNPVIGSAIGGGVYELGQGIMEGDEFPELMQRSGFGAAIGGAAGGAVSKAPQAAKFVNDLSGGKIGNALKPIGEKITNSKLYDALMTDIKAFNPNKQTMYHGSPADFNKFDNAYIGTGEGAQAHGYGHYAALNKDVAEGYRNKLSTTTPEENLIKQYGKEQVIKDLQKKLDDSLQELQALQKAKIEQGEIKDFGRRKPIDYDSSIKLVEEEINSIQNRIYNVNNPQTSGQLYKLSIPKNDVMLREDLPFSEQPKAVQDALKKLAKDYKDIGYGDLLDSIGYDEKGESFYRLYNRLAGNGENAARELNDYGIKGISYNGGIDGEAAVIFNPDDIDIVRKFYDKQGALEYLKRINPNIGSETVAIGNGLVDKNYWKQYAKDNFLGNSVDIPGYTTVNFTNNNLMRDYPYNMPEYPNLFEQLTNSKYGFSTNYNKEKDRLYDHLINNDNNRLFDYLIEVIQDNDGNIHHNYKMMKNIMRGDKP